jgi:hypothetical protein
MDATNMFPKGFHPWIRDRIPDKSSTVTPRARSTVPVEYFIARLTTAKQVSTTALKDETLVRNDIELFGATLKHMTEVI